MSISSRDGHGSHPSLQRFQKGGSLRALLLVCGLITVPSVLLLVFFLTGWMQYLFAIFVAVNVAVPVMAYRASLTLPDPFPGRDYAFSPAAQIAPADLPPLERVPAEKVSDQV